MAVPRFYSGPDELRPGLVQLPEAESCHAGRSRRLSVGDAVVLFDGRGRQGHARINAVDRGTVRVEVDNVEYVECDAEVHLTLAVSLPKGNRQDVLVEKCSELGVGAIWPMTCRRSVARASAPRLEKLRRTAIEASKQAQRAWLCDICEHIEYAEVLLRIDEFDVAFLADPYTGGNCFGEVASRKTALLLIGPEGGFSDDELSAARAAGVVSVRLGRTILRTETAAIAAAARLLAGA